jgi:hypothetical protein
MYDSDSKEGACSAGVVEFLYPSPGFAGRLLIAAVLVLILSKTALLEIRSSPVASRKTPRRRGSVKSPISCKNIGLSHAAFFLRRTCFETPSGGGSIPSC